MVIIGTRYSSEAGQHGDELPQTSGPARLRLSLILGPTVFTGPYLNRVWMNVGQVTGNTLPSAPGEVSMTLSNSIVWGLKLTGPPGDNKELVFP